MSASNMTGYVYDPVFLKHNFLWHPENANRLDTIMRHLEKSNLTNTLTKIDIRSATDEEISLCHSLNYIETVKSFSAGGEGNFDPDTYYNRFTFEAAAKAAGSLIDLASLVNTGKLKNGIAFVRPPGHHAMYDRAMGFCIFNNAAIAAITLRKNSGKSKIAIVDFDVHHGNGSESVFINESGFLYISSHQDNYYPGTGSFYELRNSGPKNCIVNLPLPAGTGDKGFISVYEEIVIPQLNNFAPDEIIVSAGFDVHWKDPLAGLNVTLSGLANICRLLVRFADEFCGGKIVFTLEGGYDTDVLKYGAANLVKILTGQNDIVDPVGESPYGENDIRSTITDLKNIYMI